MVIGFMHFVYLNKEGRVSNQYLCCDFVDIAHVRINVFDILCTLLAFWM